jgi:hypothetical protein
MVEVYVGALGSSSDLEVVLVEEAEVSEEVLVNAESVVKAGHP